MLDISGTQVTQDDIRILNEYEGILAFQPTQQSKWLINSTAQVVFLCSGNRGGKTYGVAMDWIVAPILGIHPTRNITPDEKFRVIRVACEVLPGEDKENEASSSAYGPIRALLPASLIKKDVTARSKNMIVKSPLGGKDIVIEFVSYNQTEQRQAGVDRWLVWCDEAPSITFWQESTARLMNSGGPLILTYTPVAGGHGWVFDNVYENASRILRTKHVRDRILLRTGEDKPEIEKLNDLNHTDVIVCSTYDNPILNPDNIEAKSHGLDEESIDARLFGLFRELGGSIYKKFSMNCHVIDEPEFFMDGLPPANWKHFRSVDWHTREPVAIVWASLSPDDELFIWQEANPNPTSVITPQIADIIARGSDRLVFTANLIDPLANSTQANTGITTVQDLNRLFRQFKREGICSGGYWEPWDSKGEVGREKLRERLYNSLMVGKPFNNKAVREGQTINLPTIWVSRTCINVIDSLKNWRYESWAHRDHELEKGEKPKPIGRWSHFCTAIEALLKDNRVSRAHWGGNHHRTSGKRYFQAGMY